MGKINELSLSEKIEALEENASNYSKYLEAQLPYWARQAIECGINGDLLSSKVSLSFKENTDVCYYYDGLNQPSSDRSKNLPNLAFYKYAAIQKTLLILRETNKTPAKKLQSYAQLHKDVMPVLAMDRDNAFMKYIKAVLSIFAKPFINKYRFSKYNPFSTFNPFIANGKAYTNQQEKVIGNLAT